jgi:hypothetical protein
MKSPAFVRAHLGALLALGLASALAGCGNGSNSTGGGGHGTTTSTTGTTTLTSDAQTPPQGETAVKAWLAAGSYMQWHCQTAAHVARSPSPHGVNRICSNDKLSAAAGPPFPQGSASVKELWSMADGGVPDGGMVGGSIIGYAVYLKTSADSAAGANWYWYEDDPAFEQPGMVVADGMGGSGPPNTICVACHGKASATDTMHMGPGDFVYTQVK